MPKKNPKPIWRKCSRCLNGMLISTVIEDGKVKALAERCPCWKLWKSGGIAVGRKDAL
jgi:hypothetical protein